MEQAILNCAHYFANHNSFLAYMFFFVNSSLQALFPPYPGDTIIVFQGYLGTLGIFSNPLIIFCTLLGTLVCSTFLFLMCHKYGDRITSHRFFTKFFNVNKINGLKKVFKKYGACLILFNWFVPGLAMITVMAAGVFKVNRPRALISVVIAGITHNLLLMGLGFTVGYNLPLLKSILFRFNKLFILLAITLAVVSAFIYFRKNSKKSVKKAICVTTRKNLTAERIYTPKTSLSANQIKRRP